MITENLSTLKINKLTQAQYDRELEAGNIDENALYLTPDETTPKTELVLNSSTEGSAKQFKLTIGDDGVLTVTEVVVSQT